MIKSATAVKAKIKNKAGGNSDKSQIMLRIYLMERLLERVSLSKYRDNFVLKGGLLVSSLVGVDMRSTMDVDTTLRKGHCREITVCSSYRFLSLFRMRDIKLERQRRRDVDEFSGGKNWGMRVLLPQMWWISYGVS